MLRGVKDEVLRVRDAEAVGLTQRRLRGRRWSRPYRGIRVRTNVAGEVDVRVRAAALLLPPDGAVTGWAAACLLGAPWMDGRGLPVDLVVPPHRSIHTRPGIRVVRSALPDEEIRWLEGIRLTSGLRTCFELLRSGTLDEAIVGADALLRAGVANRAGLSSFVATKRGWRGVAQVRQALQLADSRSESPGESRLRLRWIGAGLPRPLVNRDLVAPDGSHLGRVDLLDVAAGLVGEYNGEAHRSVERHAADVRRQQRLEEHGLTVVRCTIADLVGPREHVADRLRAARERGLGRNRRRDRWRLVPAGFPWWLYESARDE
jgi:hypothetical protein